MKKQTPWGELEICDAHAHFFSHQFFSTLIGQSPALSQAQKNNEDAFAQVAAMTNWTLPPENPAELAAQWLAELDRQQVAAAMLMASVPNDEASIAAAVALAPQRIFGGFFVNPHQPDALERTRRAFDEMRLNVVCLFPAMFHFSMADNETVRAIVALASERPGTVALVHCGALSVGARKKLGLASKFDMRFSNPLEVGKLAAEFPTARFIIPHFGAGIFREALMLADLYPNVYLDTSSSNKWMNYEGLDLVTVFRRALKVVGHERLIFGTDSSFFPRGWVADVFNAQCTALQEIGVSNEQAAAILGGNLRRLFGQ